MQCAIFSTVFQAPIDMALSIGVPKGYLLLESPKRSDYFLELLVRIENQSDFTDMCACNLVVCIITTKGT